jgi:ATP/maltotriose-dependent transcriptional regulator MalT
VPGWGAGGILGIVISRSVSPVFVGREAEMQVMADAFAEAAGGAPGWLLVDGEAGAGKSRLVSEFSARVRDRALVLAGECVDLGGTRLPYAPFIAALLELVRQRGSAEVAALLPGNGPGELARLLPQLGRPAAGGDPETARGRLFGSLLLLLEQLAGERPLVLVIEDVHWADRSTADLLAFLVRALRHGRVLLVLTFRSEELGRIQLGRLVADLSRRDGVRRLGLPRLSRDGVAAQLEAILGRAPEPAVVSAVYQRGGGNPLFTEALLGPGGSVGRGLPWSLRELLYSRVKELPDNAQQLLRAAAVGGARAGYDLLAAVTGQGDAALDAALRSAVTAGVLVIDPDGDYAFRHELFREALLADLLPGERARAHRLFAEALQADPALSPDHLPSVQLAVHWQGAGEDERALRAAWTAAVAAGAAFAYAEQLQMLELVMELWERAPNAAVHVCTDRADVVETAAGAARLAGEPERGLVLVEAAISGLDQARDAERAASLLRLRAALRAQLLLPGQLDDLQAALGLVTHPTRVRAGVLAQLIGHLWLQDRIKEARPLAAELQTLAERLGDEEYRIEAQIRLAQLGGDGGDIIPVMEEAARAARRISSGRLEALARDGITYTLEARGEHEAAIRAGREDLARARQLGLSRYGTAPFAGNLAEPLTSAGRWDEAVSVIEEGLALEPAPFVRWFLLACRAEIAVARGEAEMAARILRELRSLPAAEAETHRRLGLARLDIQIRLAQGDLDGAVSVAGTVPGMPTGDPRYLWPLLTAAMSACAAAAATGSPAPSGVHDALVRLADSTAQPGPVERAHAAVFTGEAARAHGHPDRTAWDAAAAAWEKLGQPYSLACALLRAADVAAVEGDRDAATARLHQAAELVGRLGAGPLLQQITRLAQRARIDLPGAAGGSAAPFGLTARELEVLRLVAAGRSNQQIATELFISPKTASVHVSNILGKLGVTNRVEAAFAAHRLHLAGPG